ncbi:lycopene cyclase family protein [Candidatus Pelagibacter sp. RS40]|uniref:lycopene cyclase family protein n=1 Tax=Candidatus Pelagibacter sp. RS40 TaxID=1977865 RepID=UPI000A14DE45|nr:lycopene cyclase family protein [Candidatus Pelagibacter sp. RS40]ARJ48848.1 lycopene cyclase [Candidatus Pelagibacter sp. RS40]
MKDFDIVIIGGGCSGLSLAYQLEINSKLKGRSLAIIDNRDRYFRDKTWSFWRVNQHDFEDCVIKSWKQFSINSKDGTLYKDCNKYPYQSIDSGLFYDKILNKLKQNKNIYFFKSKNEININSSIVFNSVPEISKTDDKLWQHFCGYEIETDKEFFDEEIMNLMDFDCDQKDSVHFFYTLPFSKNKALVETTWLSTMNNQEEEEYDQQLLDYIKNHLNLKNYRIKYKEVGKIPLFRTSNINNQNLVNIGTAGGMTRLSTGYTFLNIQEQSKYLAKNIEKFRSNKAFKIGTKYEFLDKIFLRVLKKSPKIMPNVFYKMFNSKSEAIINFLSNKSHLGEDLSIILKMPKIVFLKAIFQQK